MRQLSRRNPRRRGQARRSIASDAAILSPEGDQKSFQMNGGRSRSLSASSAILLNKQSASDPRRSVGLDSISASGAALNQIDSESAPYTPSNGRAASAFSYLPGSSQNGGHGGSGGVGIINAKNAEAADPYYRPPRPRRLTTDAYTPGPASRGSWNSGEWANRRWSQHSPPQEGSPNRADGLSVSGRGTPVPAHLGGLRERSDSNAEDPRRSKTDYATREVDFYYGVRGPALSNQPTRRRKTGPADPTGPVSSATGWLKSLFGGKTKEAGKGFEVVRSSRAPPPNSRVPSRALVLDEQSPYTDDPAIGIERSRDLALSDDGDAIGGGTRHLPAEDRPSPLNSDEEQDQDGTVSEDDYSPANRESQVSPFPPSLPVFDTGGSSLEMPSRMASRTSSVPTRDNTRDRRRPPVVPRRSSRRQSQHDALNYPGNESVQLSTISPSPQSTPQRNTRLYNPDQAAQGRLQPPETSASRHPQDSDRGTPENWPLSAGADSSTKSSLLVQTDDGNPSDEAGHARHSSSVLGSLAPDLRQDRPQSMGYVQQHRASDNIHRASPDDTSHMGSSAEIVDDPFQRSPSPDTRRQYR